MRQDLKQLFYDIETHNAGGVRSYFAAGNSPNEVHEGVPLFTTMIEMYLRSPRFTDCLRAFIDYGLVYKGVHVMQFNIHPAF